MCLIVVSYTYIKFLQKKRLKLSVLMAERKGFEPLVELEPHTDVPGLHLKPLGHLSSGFLNLTVYG